MHSVCIYIEYLNRGPTLQSLKNMMSTYSTDKQDDGPIRVAKELYPDLSKGLDWIIDIPAEPSEIGRIVKTGWNPKMLKEVTRGYMFPDAIRKATTQREVATRFLEFYVSGQIPDTHSVPDIILAMASMVQKDDARASTDLIWPDTSYSKETCLYSLAGEQSEILTLDASNDERTLTIALSNVPDLRVDKGVILDKRVSIPVLQHDFKDTALERFYKVCANIINRIESHREVSPSQLAIYKVLNVLALTMMRAFIMNTTDYLNHNFLYHNLLSKFGKLFIGPAAQNYSPPCKPCLALVRSYIDTVTLGANRAAFVAHCVEVYTTPAFMKTKARTILGASFIIECCWNGMDIIRMIVEISNKSRRSWKDFMFLTATWSTYRSWIEIKNFFVNYQKSGAPDNTVAWARIIDDDYFTEFDCKNHRALSALLQEKFVNYQQIN